LLIIENPMRAAIDILEERIGAVMAAVCGREGCSAIVRPATDPKFGDYQANGVMALAKQIKTNPRKLAEEVVEKLQIDDMCEPPEVAGPGFINLRLKSDFIAERLLEINADSEDRLGIDKLAEPKTIVVDFSGPNIAKQMHVGHLRSTIIGDCICRTLEFLGHKVIRQNHIGDWGTQFGMLIRHMYKVDDIATKGNYVMITSIIDFTEFEQFYKEAKTLFDTDENFARESRDYVVKLQSGDEDTINDWKLICQQSLQHCQGLYDALGVTLKPEDVRGESAYKDDLAGVVEALKADGNAEESDGAICVFPEGFKNKDGERLPLIVQKSDGAYLYATTDLAAIRYRIDQLKAKTIIYVTDSRQKLHFEMLFATAKLAKWVGDDVELSHVMFGSVLGENGTPLKTRSGENVKLKDLLDEAVERAMAVVEEKNPELSAKKKDEIAQAVGIGAVKYADYSNNRTSDYIFSFDKMLAMDGNTAPYMQYAYARIKSIERKAKSRDVDIETELVDVETLDLSEPDELALAKHLLRYGEAIEAAACDYRPNYLTAYLYELAQKFSGFYTNCPVLDAGPDKRPTRLMLCRLTEKTIEHGLSKLLGIKVIEQM
jgi:arginyl-tRNA synthetase